MKSDDSSKRFDYIDGVTPVTSAVHALAGLSLVVFASALRTASWQESAETAELGRTSEPVTDR